MQRFGKRKITFTPTVSLRMKEMQIHFCTVEGAAQTNLSAVLLFWIA